jgi:hypothetical protein
MSGSREINVNLRVLVLAVAVNNEGALPDLHL